MITPAQINAENFTDPLTDNQVIILTMLIRRYPRYYNASGLYPAIADKFAAEVAVPTANTAALKAILTQLGTVPVYVVESSGSATSQSFFSTVQNWEELAQDVLDVFYDIPVGLTQQSYAIAQRRNENIQLHDPYVGKRLLRKRPSGRRIN